MATIPFSQGLYIAPKRERVSGAAWLYHVLSLCGFALLSVNFKGPDPTDFLFPALLMLGAGVAFLRPRRDGGRTHWFLIAFLLFYALSALVGSPAESVTLHTISNVALLIFVRLYVGNIDRAKLVFGGLLSGVALSSLVGLAIMLGYFSPGSDLFEQVRDARLLGLKGDPNILGIVTAFCAIWLFDELVDPKLWPGCLVAKTVLIAGAVLQVILTFSRAALLDLGAGLLVYMLVSLKRKSIKRLTLMSLVVVAVGASVAVTSVNSDVLLWRWETSLNPDPDELVRFDHTLRAIELAKDHPLGIGPGRTEIELGVLWSNLGAHNTFVQILSDNGWLAFGVFCLWCLHAGRLSIGKAKSGASPINGISWRMIAAASAGLLVASLFHDLLYWNVCWIVPGLAWSMDAPTRSTQPQRRPFATQ